MTTVHPLLTEEKLGPISVSDPDVMRRSSFRIAYSKTCDFFWYHVSHWRMSNHGAVRAQTCHFLKTSLSNYHTQTEICLVPPEQLLARCDETCEQVMVVKLFKAPSSNASPDQLSFLMSARKIALVLLHVTTRDITCPLDGHPSNDELECGQIVEIDF